MLEPGDAATLPADPQLLERRGAVARRDVLLIAGEDAARGPAELHREERRDDRVLPHTALRAEAAAHVVADHADLRVRQLQRDLESLPDTEDVLRRLVHGELIAVP